MIRLRASGIAAAFLPDCGFLAELAVTDRGAVVAPMHRAPWIGESLPEGAPPHQAWLQGDFFCAPFGDAGADGAPLHGWPANGHWSVTEAAPGSIVATLDRTVMGAGVTKTLAVRDGDPWVYQTHSFHGGAGRMGAANHAMVSLPHGGLICLSPKAAFRTSPSAPEPDPARGRSALRYPASATDPRAFPGQAGPVDLTTYPFGPAHEDFVVALEPVAAHLAWTAVVRPAEGDCWLSLRRAAEAPATRLWQSNGGRDYAPWSGRHRGCLGVEEGFPGPILGADDPDRRDLMLGGTVRMRHVTGAFRWPTGARVMAVAVEGDSVVVTGAGGAERRLPVDPGHLA
ncbi:MAG: hypothetical protein ACT4OK_14905 [Gemmobacter sp.]